MAMTFTIASAAREALSAVIADRLKREQEEDDRKAREYEEVSLLRTALTGWADAQAEAARTRGTPVTHESFAKWRKGFVARLRAKRDKEEEDRVKALTPREREDYKKKKERPTGELERLRRRQSADSSGKQLFETSQTLATSDEGLYEEGGEAVDMSKYTREEREAERRREEEEEERRRAGLVAGDESD
jgi:hypothetical protein